MTTDYGFQAPTARLSGAGTVGLVQLGDAEHGERLRKMREGKLGSVHSWELVTAVDGPGTRMTVFLSGCPLRCLYCHNPDTLEMRRGQPIETEELMKRIKRYRSVFRASHGGVTLSGGEVLMQPAFAARILHECKELGIHTCIDTSGFLGVNCTDLMLEDIDLVLLDIKSGDEQTYRKVTGRSLQPTLEFGNRLAEAGVETWIRFVLVPGLTDAQENIENVADIAASWDNVTRVEVLPFHQMGADKWSSLGMKYELSEVSPPTQEEVERARNIFRERGLTTY